MDETQTHARTGFEIQSRPLPPKVELDYAQLEYVITRATQRGVEKGLWLVRLWFRLLTIALVLVCAAIITQAYFQREYWIPYVRVMMGVTAYPSHRYLPPGVSSDDLEELPADSGAPIATEESVPTQPPPPAAKKNYPPSYKPFYGEDSATRKPKPARP